MIKALLSVFGSRKVQIGVLGGIVYVVASAVASGVNDPALAAQLYQLAEWAAYFTGMTEIAHFVTDNTSLTTGAQQPRKLPGAVDATH